MSNSTHFSNLERPTSLVSVKTASQMLGSDPWTVAQLVEADALPSGRIGERIVIPEAAVLDYAARLTREAS